MFIHLYTPLELKNYSRSTKSTVYVEKEKGLTPKHERVVSIGVVRVFLRLKVPPSGRSVTETRTTQRQPITTVGDLIVWSFKEETHTSSYTPTLYLH